MSTTSACVPPPEPVEVDAEIWVLRVGIAPEAQESLAALPQALEASLRAVERLVDDAVACQHARDGRPRPWPGAEAAASRLVGEILKAQESHFCCAESSTLLVAWHEGPAPEAGVLLERLRARLVERRAADARQMASRAEQHPPSAVSRAVSHVVTSVMQRALGIDLGGPPPSPEHAADIDVEAGDVGLALHEAAGARLTLQAQVSFAQGRYSCECSCYGSELELQRLRAGLCQSLSALSGVTVAG